ncbi:sensor response regulator hybrid [Lasius niger]|uniref:Sensor response regulator hybrid n=1 Tax=Lasius niger TaxID=67767 RepID=A0A0J7K1M4_LASNI|nr:sensor response regulator hybrid [Lasius niger]
MTLTVEAHVGVGDAVQIGDVRQADSAPNQLCAAVPYRISPDLLQELLGVTRRRQRRITALLMAQRQETIGKDQPQLAHILQTLLAPGGGVARPEQPRLAAIVEQQIA